MHAEAAALPPRQVPGITRIVARFVLVTSAAAAILCHLVYFAHDRRGFVDHDGFYTAPFLPLLDLLRASDWPGFLWSGLELDYPLVNWLLAMWSRAVGPGFFTYFLFSLFFLLGLTLLAAWQGERRGGPLAGALCALAAATCPILDNASRKYFVEFHASVFVFAAYCLALLATAHPRRLGPGVAAGVGALAGLGWVTHPIAVVQTAPALVLAVWAIVRAPRPAASRARLTLWLAAPLAPPMLWIAHLGPAYFVQAAQRVGAAFPGGRPEAATFARWAWDFLVEGSGPWVWGLGLGAAALVANAARERQVDVERAFLLLTTILFAALSCRGYARGQGLHMLLFYPLAFALFLPEIARLIAAAHRPRRLAPVAGALAVLAAATFGFAGKFGVWSKASEPEPRDLLRLDRRYIAHSPSLLTAAGRSLAAPAARGGCAVRADFDAPLDHDADAFMGAKDPCLHLERALRMAGAELIADSPRRWRIRAAYGRRLDWASFVADEIVVDPDGVRFLAGIGEKEMPWIAAIHSVKADAPAAGFACRIGDEDWTPARYSTAWRMTHP